MYTHTHTHYSCTHTKPRPNMHGVTNFYYHNRCELVYALQTDTFKVQVHVTDMYNYACPPVCVCMYILQRYINRDL